MQFNGNTNDDVKNKQEKDGFLLPVLSAVWREWRSLLYLNFTLDLFIVFPTLFIMGIALAWPTAVTTVLLILSAASVLSVPAALCGANRITVSMVRQENFFLIHDFWKTFKESYIKALLGGLFYTAVLGLLGFSGYCAYSLFGRNPLMYISIAIVLSAGIVFFTAGLYFWPMLALIDLPVRPIIKNSLLIVPAVWKRSLLALLATLVFAVFLACFTVGTALFLAGIFFLALYILLVNFAVYPGISRLVILRQSPKPTGTLIKQIDGKVLKWEEEQIAVDKTEEVGENKIPDEEPAVNTEQEPPKEEATGKNPEERLNLKWEE